MKEAVSTLTGSGEPYGNHPAPEECRPGVVQFFSCGRPTATVLFLNEGTIELGRSTPGLSVDPRMSRRHTQVSFDGSRFHAKDLGSQNGTLCDGKPMPSKQTAEVQRVLRVGDSLFGVLRNALPLAEMGVQSEGGWILGPSLQRLLAEVRQAAKFGETLHITGESGTGKELMAHTFHDHGPRSGGAFVPVNCAAIPKGLAERLLFGARRGAYSGADAHSEGYVQAAAGGTLFLDEVADLDLSVQAKLLRVLETREILPLGASRPSTIELHICSATNKNLKAMVAAGRFREDLYYRIGRPIVAIPPLRKRPEEIPWLIEAAIKRITANVLIHPSLVETCLLRPWPGNVRELLIEVRSAALVAIAHGCPRVEARHLPDGAGTIFHSAQGQQPADLAESAPNQSPVKPLDPAEHARLETALRSHNGNVSGAARALGLHRTQMRRMLDRHGLDPQRFIVGDKPSHNPDDL